MTLGQTTNALVSGAVSRFIEMQKKMIHKYLLEIVLVIALVSLWSGYRAIVQRWKTKQKDFTLNYVWSIAQLFVGGMTVLAYLWMWVFHPSLLVR